MRSRTILALVALSSLGVLAAGSGDLEQEHPGQKEGLPGYDGSEFCQACHPAEHQTWKSSHHARTVHAPTDRDLELLGQSLLCGDYDAKYVLGQKHARRFMVDSTREEGMHVLLPCRYDVGTAEWTHLHEDDWETLTWERGCGACHTTGFSSDDFTYKEMRVGCESCHGPGSRHGGYKTREEMISFADLSPVEEAGVCASCHLQGGVSRRTGLNFATTTVQETTCSPTTSSTGPDSRRPRRMSRTRSISTRSSSSSSTQRRLGHRTHSGAPPVTRSTRAATGNTRPWHGRNSAISAMHVMISE